MLEPWLRSVVARLNSNHAEARAFDVLFAGQPYTWGMPRSTLLDAARWWPSVITTGPRASWELRSADGLVLAVVEAPPPAWEYRIPARSDRER